MKKANSAVASVRTSAVLVNGILYLLASARLMLSNPTAILCDHFERAAPGGEDFGVDRIAQSGDQAIHAGLHLFNNQAFRRSFGLGIDFHVVSLMAKNVEGISDVAGGKNADSLAHGARTVYRRDLMRTKDDLPVNPVTSVPQGKALTAEDTGFTDPGKP